MDKEKDVNSTVSPLTQGVVTPSSAPTLEAEVTSASTSDDTPQEFKLDSESSFSSVDSSKPKQSESKEKLAEMMKETFEKEKEKKAPTSSRLVYYILSVIIILLAVVIVWQLNLQREVRELASNLRVTIVPQNDLSPTDAVAVSSIQVISPEEFEEVVGEIDYNFESEGLEGISMKIFDDNGIEIGDKLAITVENADKATVLGTLDISRSPTTNEGYLIVYPADQDVNSSIAVTVSVSFQKTFRIDKLTVYGPVNNQLIKGTELRFVGEMKGFEGNKFQFVLKDDAGKVINTGQVVSASEKVTADFLKFDQTIKIGTLPQSITEVGRIDFYDVGSDTNSAPLLTVPVRFR